MCVEKTTSGIRLIGRGGVDIEAVALDRHSSCLVADAAELSVEIVSDAASLPEMDSMSTSWRVSVMASMVERIADENG
jgi:hypothetical protein